MHTPKHKHHEEELPLLHLCTVRLLHLAAEAEHIVKGSERQKNIQDSNANLHTRYTAI